jgi:hypothetical protein
LQGLPGGIVLGAQSGGEIAGNLVSRNVVLDNGDNGTLPGAGIVLEVPFGISFTGISPVHSVLYREAAEMRPRNGAPVASGSVSGNMVVGNLISRNGLPGVTVLNASPPGLADLSGDMVDRNVIERNNAEGLVIRPSMAGPAPGALVRNLGLSVADRQATGVLVASGSPLTIEVSSNTVVGDYFGVWLSPAVNAPTAIFNQFIGVPVPVFRSPV